MKKPFNLICISLIFLASCHKSTCSNAEKASFKDLTGLDGCGIVIEQSNGQRLEPTNLDEFSITPVNDMDIWVKYHNTNGGSICMVGEIVEIECISERN